MFLVFLMQFNMDRVNVEEFYEVYKGVVSEYNVSVQVRGSSGLCLAYLGGLGVSFNQRSTP